MNRDSWNTKGTWWNFGNGKPLHQQQAHCTKLFNYLGIQIVHYLLKRKKIQINENKIKTPNTHLIKFNLWWMKWIKSDRCTRSGFNCTICNPIKMLCFAFLIFLVSFALFYWLVYFSISLLVRFFGLCKLCKWCYV